MAVVAMIISLHFFVRFYPPGHGYAEEKRNNKIAAGFALIAAGLVAAPFLV